MDRYKREISLAGTDYDEELAADSGEYTDEASYDSEYSEEYEDDFEEENQENYSDIDISEYNDSIQREIDERRRLRKKRMIHQANIARCNILLAAEVAVLAIFVIALIVNLL